MIARLVVAVMAADQRITAAEISALACRVVAAGRRFRRALFLLVAAVLFAGCARQEEEPLTAAAILYHQYCAACHGAEGRGDGPAAPALRPGPTDLTRLTSTIPEIMDQIDGRRTIRAHGMGKMPVWGKVFERSAVDDPNRERTALVQIHVLAEYVYELRNHRTENE